MFICSSNVLCSNIKGWHLSSLRTPGELVGDDGESEREQSALSPHERASGVRWPD